MTESAMHNNTWHAKNVALLAQALERATSEPIDRVAVAGLLLTFRYAEYRRRLARRACDVNAPSPHESKQRVLLLALRATIISRMQEPAEEAL